MSKIYGLKSEFALVRRDISRTVIGYGLTPLEDGEHATWHEVVIYRKDSAYPTLSQVKEAVIADINRRTDAKILNGYQFTPDGAEEAVTVWLSDESQRNFSEAQRLEIVPVKFKLNETDDKQPIYHTFETFEELDRFYKGGVAYINLCLNEGWGEKDSIDWSVYEEALENPVIDGFPEPEPEPSEDEPSEQEQEETAEETAGKASDGENTTEETS